MKLILTFILIPFLLSSQIDNSIKHKYAGAIITIGTSELLQQINVKPKYAIMIGFGTGLLAGACKELIYDKQMKKGNCNKYDFFDTAWGSLCGVTVSIAISEIKKIKK